MQLWLGPASGLAHAPDDHWQEGRAKDMVLKDTSSPIRTRKLPAFVSLCSRASFHLEGDPSTATTAELTLDGQKQTCVQMLMTP